MFYCLAVSINLHGWMILSHWKKLSFVLSRAKDLAAKREATLLCLLVFCTHLCVVGLIFVLLQCRETVVFRQRIFLKWILSLGVECSFHDKSLLVQFGLVWLRIMKSRVLLFLQFITLFNILLKLYAVVVILIIGICTLIISLKYLW